MTSESPPTPPPETLRAAGCRLWESIAGQYELEEHEVALLVEACRTADILDELDELVLADGALIDSPQGRKANPAVVESRQQRQQLVRLLAALRLPTGEEGDEQPSSRPQRRGTPRGSHSPNIQLVIGGKAS